MTDPIESAANAAFSLWGLEGTSLLTTMIIASLVCQLVARLIPDDAIGWQGTVRKVCAVIGLYASSRVTSGITVKDIVREVAKVPQEAAEEVRERVSERIEDEISGFQEDVLELRDRAPIVPAFPGLKRRRDPVTGEFLPYSGDDNGPET